MFEWLKSFLKIIGVICFLVGMGLGVAYLTLRILVPSERMIVPLIVGKDLKEAIIFLGDEDIPLKIVGKKYSSEVPQDVVISQVPPPGTQVRSNRVIEVVISEGRRLIPAPSVVGLHLREAKINLSQEGLHIKAVDSNYSNLPRDEIIAQDPLPTSKMERAEGINLLVSLGEREPLFCMPDFVQQKVTEVQEFLERTSLKIGKIKEVPSLGKEGMILSQVPSPGSMVNQETSIEFLVSSLYQKKPVNSPQSRWILTSVEIPEGVSGKEVTAEIVDKTGVRTVNYGEKSPGKRIWIPSHLFGEGEIRIYLDGKLAMIKIVE